MAKRKRLEMPKSPNALDLETKSALPPRTRVPIADVAGDVAGRAALEEVAREMTLAQSEGRVVRKLALDAVVTDHLARDRLVLEGDDLKALMASMAERGQQTPIDVVQLSATQYGLISGLRRMEALRALGETQVLALIKSPESGQLAYKAMVEENEIRANLSFYERAHIAIASVEQGIYPDVRAAVAGLFAHAAPAKRSKILKFVTLCDVLGASLRFPTSIPEKLGLALAQAIEADHKLASRLKDALRKTVPSDVAAERKMLERALKKQPSGKAMKAETLAQGLDWQAKAGRVVVSGAAVDERFIKALRRFMISHAKTKD